MVPSYNNDQGTVCLRPSQSSLFVVLLPFAECLTFHNNMATFEPHDLPTTSRAADFAGGFNTPAAGLSALSIIGPLFALVLVSNRIYWRLKKVGNVWYDDWCIIVSLVVAGTHTHLVTD